MSQLTSNNKNYIVRVVFDLAIDKSFDYRVDEEELRQKIAIGMRVIVNFGNRNRIGIIIEKREDSRINSHQLKKIDKLLEEEILISPNILIFCQKVSKYYYIPLGKIIFQALPNYLRKGKRVKNLYSTTEKIYYLVDKNYEEQKIRTTQQKKVLNLLKIQSDLSQSDLLQIVSLNVLKRLVDRKIVNYKKNSLSSLPQPIKPSSNKLQVLLRYHAIVEKIAKIKTEPLLLNGSRELRWEIYGHLINKLTAKQEQILIIVPEINYIYPLKKYLAHYTKAKIMLYHTKINERELTRAWIDLKKGAGLVLITTRSGAFASFLNLKLIIVEMEEDQSHKDFQKFFYSARDLAVMRSRVEKIPLILGSLTPSLATLYNVKLKKYQEIQIKENKQESGNVFTQIIDIRDKRLIHGLAPSLLKEIKEHLFYHNQVLVVTNGRGYAPVVICKHCSWIAKCVFCQSTLAFHIKPVRLQCNRCNYQREMLTFCLRCNSINLHLLGAGSEKIKQTLATYFPHHKIINIDDEISSGFEYQQICSVKEGDIFITNPSSLKNYHISERMSLACFLNIDRDFAGSHLSSMEKSAQLFTQIKSEYARREKAGKLIIQGFNVENPYLITLVNEGFRALSEKLLAQRKKAKLPPYSYSTLIHIYSEKREKIELILKAIKKYSDTKIIADCEILGPVRERYKSKANFHYKVLLLSFRQAEVTQTLKEINELIDQFKGTNIRVIFEIDPMEF